MMKQSIYMAYRLLKLLSGLLVKLHLSEFIIHFLIKVDNFYSLSMEKFVPNKSYIAYAFL